jgi:hypothetical protein
MHFTSVNNIININTAVQYMGVLLTEIFLSFIIRQQVEDQKIRFRNIAQAAASRVEATR